MILPSVRASFGRREAQILLALAGPEGEARLGEQGIDALLDDARLTRELLMREQISTAPAPLVFYLLVRHALLAREIFDRPLADYTAAVLLEFSQTGRAFSADGTEESRFLYLADILMELERARGEREFQLRVHLGNFALWLAGIFPDHITHRVQRRGAPPLNYYDQMGAMGYRLAAATSTAAKHGLGDLLLRASERFTDVRSALNGLSDALFFPRPSDAVERVLREVQDHFARQIRQ